MDNKRFLKIISLYIFFILIPISYILGNGIINSFIVLSIIFSLIFLERNKIFSSEKKIIFTFFLLFFYLQINSIFINYENSNLISSISYLRFFLFSLIILYLLQVEFISLKHISNIFIVITLFVSIDIIYQYVFYKDLFGYKPGICSYPKGVPLCERFSGVFGDELIGGSFLANFGIFSICLYLYCNKINKKQILFSSIFGILTISAIIISGERSALLTAMYCLIIYTIFNKNLRSLLIKIVVIVSVIIIIAINFSDNAKHRFVTWPYDYLINLPGDNLFIKYLHSSWGSHYISAYYIFSENIIFGTGIKSFREVCKPIEKNKIIEKYNILRTDQPKNFCSTHPHNMQIEMLSDLGIIGFVLIHLLFYYILFDKYSLKNNISEKNKNIALFILVLISANFLPFRPSGSFFSTLPAYNIWILVGFYLYFANRIELNEK